MRHAGRKDAFAEFATIIYRHFLVNALLIFSLTLAHSTGQKRDLVSNETVRALAGQPLAPSFAARRWVGWYGHVLRMPPHHPSRAILDFEPGLFGWKRPRGAPRTRWIDVVRRDLDQLGLVPAAIEPLAQDRDEWRALVNLVGSTHDAPCTRHDDDDDRAK